MPAALVLGWRLTDLYPADAGPLPWLPAAPDHLTDHPDWGPYLTGRANRVDDLAAQVRTSTSTTPGWLPQGLELPAEVAKDVTVCRAAHGIPDTDTRTTGAQQSDFTAREHQRQLDQRVGQHLDRQDAAWFATITELVGRTDSHTPVLAQRLAKLAQQGRDGCRLLEVAMSQGALPDDHPTAALSSRITRLVANTERAPDAGRLDRSIEQQPSIADRSPGIGV